MLYIKANKIKFRYNNQSENILKDISFEINSSDKIGLIGKNGSGKTSILKLLMKKVEPVYGNIFIRKGLQIGFLPQEINLAQDISVTDFLWESNPILFELKKKLDNLERYADDKQLKIISEFEENRGYEFENSFDKIISQFEMGSTMLDRLLSTLSGGEKTKIALCRIMLNEPDILLLDEPTNHLDVKTLNWLEDYLQKIKIPFLVISHDRKFLDNCVNEIWELENKTLNKYSGNYSFYKSEKETELRRKLHDYKEHQKKIKQLKKTLTQRRNWALSHQPQTGKEGYAPVYEMVTNPAKNAMKRAKNIETRIKKEIEKEEAQKPFIEKKRKIYFQSSQLKSRFVLRAENLGKVFGSKYIFSKVSFSLKNHSHLAIVGDNGSGKTTLLKILIGEIDEFEGTFSWNPQVSIGYYSQEFETLNEENSIISEVTGGKNELQQAARTILGSLNLRNDAVYKKIKELSIGEKSKTSIAKILISQANVLVLDEPTNHLEISAREALEDALQKFDGTIIFVSHDRYFTHKLATDYLYL